MIFFFTISLPKFQANTVVYRTVLNDEYRHALNDYLDILMPTEIVVPQAISVTTEMALMKHLLDGAIVSLPIRESSSSLSGATSSISSNDVSLKYIRRIEVLPTEKFHMGVFSSSSFSLGPKSGSLMSSQESSSPALQPSWINQLSNEERSALNGKSNNPNSKPSPIFQDP